MRNRAGQILRERRLELGLTQEEVALELHMSIHQYQRYEYGEAQAVCVLIFRWKRFDRHAAPPVGGRHAGRYHFVL